MTPSINTNLSSLMNIRAKFRNYLLTFIALMLGFGQWNDTKDLAINIYEGIISNFTHNVEYRTLQKIDVGVTKDYLESLVGKPKVIKMSSISPKHTFEYFFNEKYLLTAIYKNQRLEGFTVMAKTSDFSPKIPFSKNHLNSLSIEEINSHSTDDVAADNINLAYYIESNNLGYSGMFLTRSIGNIDYSGNENILSSTLYELQQNIILGNNEGVINKSNIIRNKVKPNFYAITALDSQVINESLLTKYEYSRYY